MTAGHLVSNGDLSLLSDINTHELVYSGSDVVAVFSCEYFYVNDYTRLAMGNSEGRIPYFPCLLAENRSEKSFLGCKLGLSLRSNLSDKYIVRANLRSDADNSSFVEVSESVLADVRNIPCYFFGSEFCIPCLGLKFLYMNGCIYVLLNKSLAEKNSILVVITFPCHESDKRVLSEGKLSVACGSSVSDYPAGLYPVALVYDGSLVHACALVASLELDKMVNILLSAVSLYNNLVGRKLFDNTAVFSHNGDTRVFCRLVFHTCSYYRRVRRKKGHSLTLHVGTHKGTVSVVVLKERNEGRSYGNHLLGRNVHKLYFRSVNLDNVLAVTSCNLFIYEMAFLVKGLIGLSYVVVFLLVRGNIYYLVCNSGDISALVNDPVRSLDKSVLIDTRECGKGVDKTDVGSLWRLYGAHSSVMRMVNVSNLKSGSFS